MTSIDRTRGGPARTAKLASWCSEKERINWSYWLRRAPRELEVCRLVFVHFWPVQLGKGKKSCTHNAINEARGKLKIFDYDLELEPKAG